MKKMCLVLSLCLVLLCLGCTEKINEKKYQRISFDQEALEEELSYIDENTVVVNNADEVFPTQLPIYEITPRNITQQEFDEIVDALKLPNDAASLELDGNRFFYNRVSYADYSRGYFNMTDEELEKEARRVFELIPFLEGEYKYMGIKSRMIKTDSEGKHITRVGVRFQLLLDGCRVAGNQEVMIYFDGGGLVEIVIKVFEYKQIGTMELISLNDAKARIKTPDDFNFDGQTGTIQTLNVNRNDLVFINQFHKGCTILQPIYNFSGTATLKDGSQSDFSSRVIAIPESYTYEAE